jgi:S1-C subfamily serine protease
MHCGSALDMPARVGQPKHMRFSLFAAGLSICLSAFSVPAHGFDRRSPVVEAVEKVSPAVVNISTTQVTELQVTPFPAWRDPTFDQFFRDFFEPRRQRLTQTSLGSGVIIRSDGYILTNQHVVLRATKITVSVANGDDYEASLAGADPDSDLAVLRVKTNKALPAVAMGRSNDLMIGETVIAIGNPFGLSHTVTTGVVSAVGRSLRTDTHAFYDLIQTDASINPGNSGGPLLNINGELIGINSAIYQNAQGIGFAIPIDRARRVVTDLIAYGEVQPPWVGFVAQDLTFGLRRQLHLGGKEGGGCLVTLVQNDGPGDRAGLQPGDVILAVDGRPIASADEWESRLHDTPIGHILQFKIFRQGKHLTISLPAEPMSNKETDALAWNRIGLRVAKAQSAVRVTAIRGGSPGHALGLKPGDLIVALDGHPTPDLHRFRTRVAACWAARSILITVERGGHVYNAPLSLTPPYP